MITIGKLLWSRIKRDWLFQYDVWKLAVDWVIALYIIIPFSILGIYQYNLWLNHPPAWFSFLNISFLSSILFLFTWKGGVRVFIDEGDQLFLVQHNEWMRGLTRLSLGYSLLTNLVVTGLLFLLLSPFLISYYQLSVASIAAWGTFTYLMKIIIALAKQLINLNLRGIVDKIVSLIFFITAGLIYRLSVGIVLKLSVWTVLIILLATVLLVFLLIIRVNLKGSFFDDVIRERDQLLRFSTLLFGMSGTSWKKPRPIRDKPFLFHRSNRIFKTRTPINGLVEFYLKTVIRSIDKVSQYLMLLFGLFLVAFTVPQYLQGLIYIAAAFILAYLGGLFWLEVVNSSFVRIFQLEKLTKLKAAEKGLWLLTLPGFLLLSISLGWSEYQGMGAVLAIPISIFITFIAARIVASSTY